MFVVYQTPYNGDAVAVSGLIGIIIPATQIKAVDAWEVTLRNPDATQVLTAQLEQALTSAGPWDVYDADTFGAMDPNAVPARAVLVRFFESKGDKWVRVRGTTNGAGINAVERTLKTYLRRGPGGAGA